MMVQDLEEEAWRDVMVSGDGINSSLLNIRLREEADLELKVREEGSFSPFLSPH
jgi:hypothetical protein